MICKKVVWSDFFDFANVISPCTLLYWSRKLQPIEDHLQVVTPSVIKTGKNGQLLNEGLSAW